MHDSLVDGDDGRHSELLNVADVVDQIGTTRLEGEKTVLEFPKEKKLYGTEAFHHNLPQILTSQRIPTKQHPPHKQTPTHPHEVQMLRLVGDILDVNRGPSVTLEGADRRHDDGALEE